VAGLLAAAGPASAKTMAQDSWEAARNGVASSEVFELNTFGGNDTLRADCNEVAVEGITLAHERYTLATAHVPGVA
jgi:hypothetical protein